MAILAFQRPEKVIMIKSDDKHGVFEFRPLEPGYGITIGNALRRILLSSLEGFAITSLRIEGVSHEFSTIKGVMEDVINIILNLKEVRFKQQIEELDNEKVTMTITGQNVLKAGDFNRFLNNFQVLNPELEICHMEQNVKLVMEIEINKGRGYVHSDENKIEGAPVDTIAIDSIHTPIINVEYKVDNFRVEQKTDYEKLILDITTDGSISPKNALKEAAKILIFHFMLFSDEKIAVENDDKSSSEPFDEGDLHMRQLLKTKLSDMDLSVRALNCLRTAEVETIGDLVAFNRNDLLKFRNFGNKSLSELDKLVKSKNLEFGMNVAKYKLDRD